MSNPDSDLPPGKQPPETASGQLNLRDFRGDMMRTFVAEPLLGQVIAAKSNQRDQKFDVIIALNELFPEGITTALEVVRTSLQAWDVKPQDTPHYVFARLTADQILSLAQAARKADQKRGPIYRIWEDSEIDVSITRSASTVKADAAQRAFSALGAGIVWAVLDSGIDGRHPHFKPDARAPWGPVNNLDIDLPLTHVDFTPGGTNSEQTALTDNFGHGTHVAGIIAGSWKSANPRGERVTGTESRSEAGEKPVLERESLTAIAGLAPACKLVSMKVIADRTLSTDSLRQTAGKGLVGWVLMALDQIQQWNQHGRRVLVHGVNMSLGYDFDPRWFACGQSPVCVEVNRLVKCGVSVVVSAGNGGYASYLTADAKASRQYSGISITDPGNADLAVTVGSTHRDMPHTYGVSYFSSRGPTGDGRMKPDLVAPGERIISCAAGAEANKYGTETDASGKETAVLYCEQSGTSMAAPHVSAAIAAFLSVRREFIGQPEKVKQLFVDAAVDLGRERAFQGSGLVDVMKVLQSV